MGSSDWEEEYVNDDGGFEQMLKEWVKEQSSRDRTVIINPEKYAEVLRVIQYIEKTVKRKLEKWIPQTETENYDDDGEYIDPKLYTPEFDFHFHNPILSSSVGFEVLIPEIGIDFTAGDLDEIVDVVPIGTVMSVMPKKNGYVSFSFSFPDIQSVVYND